jgi:hypothetical protein
MLKLSIAFILLAAVCAVPGFMMGASTGPLTGYFQVATVGLGIIGFGSLAGWAVVGATGRGKPQA